jgi:hypothetical protein
MILSKMSFEGFKYILMIFKFIEFVQRAAVVRQELAKLKKTAA